MTPANAPVPLQEVVEAEGHLIDSHIMERIFDTVVECDGRAAQKTGDALAQFVGVSRRFGRDHYLRLAYDDRLRKAEHRLQVFDDVGGGSHECGSLLDEPVGAARARIGGRAGHGENFAALFAGKSSCDQRARTLCRLDHNDSGGKTRNQSIAPWEVFSLLLINCYSLSLI